MIVPARLAFNVDGTPWSAEYDDVYHSADGGLEQARHVFLAGNGLPESWRGRPRFVVLETGFGLGLNFLATWQAWRDDPQRGGQLHFISVEKHPFGRDDLAALHRRWPALAPLAEELRRQWPPLASGFHRLHFDAGRVTLTLLFGDAADQLRRLDARADAIYLDGFAPAKNPDLWTPVLLHTLTRLAAPGATLATWSVAAAVREHLGHARWQLQMRPGFGQKREMLCGRLGGENLAPAAPERRAIVIGAGIAGATCAARLAARGWQIDLLERRPAPAMEASGNPAGVLLPMLAMDDNIAARLSRACYFYTLRVLEELSGNDSPLRWNQCGVVQIARHAEHEAQQRQMTARLGLPEEFVAFLERADLGQLLGHPVALGGWHFSLGGWISPPTLCHALIASGGERIRTHFGAEVTGVAATADGWTVATAPGQPSATAPHLILANAHGASRLVSQMSLPLTPVRGQVSYLPGSVLSGIAQVVCRQGYVTPPAPVGVNGELMSCLGATFDSGDDDPNPRRDGHASNLDRLEALLPGAAAGIDPGQLDGRVGFRTATPDRMPMIGTLPGDNAATRREAPLQDLERIAGLHCLLGYGARGMVWAALGAELLASQLEAEPLPLETDLVAAVDPARFLLRARRHGRR